MNWYRKIAQRYRRKKYTGPPRYFGPMRLISFMGRPTIIGNTMSIRKELPNFGFRWDGNIKIDATQIGDAPDNIINGAMIGSRELTLDEIQQLSDMGTDISMSSTIFPVWRNQPVPISTIEDSSSEEKSKDLEISEFEEDQGAQSYEANVDMLIKIRDATNYSDIKQVMQEQTKKLMDIMSDTNLSTEMLELREKFIKFMQSSHRYSFYNTMLMFLQNRNVEMAGGEKNLWNKKGREVKPGSIPMHVLAPVFWTPRLNKEEYNKRIQEYKQKGVNPQDAKNKINEDMQSNRKISRFKSVPVYDINQTISIPGWKDPQTGKPPFDYEDFHEGYKHQFNTPDEYTDTLWLAISNAVKNENIKVTTEDTGVSGGFSSGGNIAINDKSYGARRINTMFHEYAHEILHTSEEARKKWIKEKTPKKIIELEAESTAFLLMGAFNLQSDTESSAKYILLWKGMANDVQDRQQNIHKAFEHIYKQVKNQLDYMIENKQNTVEVKPQNSTNSIANFNWYEKIKYAESKMLIIMRGLPGSGKSTKAKELGKGGQVFSSDDFFMVNGEYKFDKDYLSDAHFWNDSRIIEAIKKGISPIVADNTNVEGWEPKKYVQYALANGYRVKVIEPETPWAFNPVELAKRNTHKVPLDIIEDRMNSWKHDLTVDDILESTRPKDI